MLRLRERSTRRRASAHLLDAAGLAVHRPVACLGPEPIGLGPEGWRPPSPATERSSTRRCATGAACGIGAGVCQRHHVGGAPGPLRAGRSLDDEEIARLARAAGTVLQQALDRARERISTDLPNSGRPV